MTSPTDSVATAVRELLREILPAPPCDDRPLREQGLDSMATTRLWIELQERLGVDLPLEWLAVEADPARLVARIEAQLAAEPPAAERRPRVQVSPDPERRGHPFPLTPMQEAYFLGARPELTDDPVGCDQYLELEVHDLDVERLRRAWQQLVERHEMLRSVVTADGMQRVLPEAPPASFVVHDLEAAGPDDAARALAEVRARLARRRRVTGDPPFSIEVSLRRPAAVVHLSLDMLVTDGHGLALLLAQWRACYDGARVPPAPDLSARDCVLALGARARTEAYRQDLAWWADALRELPPGPRLPAAPPGPDGLVRRALEGALTEPEWRELRARARALDVSPSALVLAVLARTIGARTGDDALPVVVTTNLRPALPAAAEALVGPFTSAAIVIARATRDPIEDGARDLQRQLWDALRHATVSAVEALRHLRGRGQARPAASLPIVFTSLLGVGPGGRQDQGFGAGVTFAVCRTSDVALEHQLWEHGDELRYRWDVTPARFPPGAPEVMFAAFENALRALCAGPGAVTHRPLNELQQAYYVARASAPHDAWNGCQIYASFEVADLDPRALERSLVELVHRHAPLRAAVTTDGRLEVRSAAPARWSIPVVEVEAARELAAIRDEMAGRAFPLGAWPAFDVRATRSGGSWTVHCAFDLAVLDARSIHLLGRELFAPRLPAAEEEEVVPPAVAAAAEACWDERLAHLPPGPALVAGEDRRRIRLAFRLAGWRHLAELAARHEVAPDALLLAAFLDVLAGRLCDRAFAVPVVRFPDAEERRRPGERTALSWIERAGGASLMERAVAYQRVLDADAAAAGATSGLRALRRRTLRARGHGDYAFPVVYTSVVDLSEAPLPPGTAPGAWLSCTPDVSLDCIGIREGDELRCCWDAVAADFAAGQLAAMFDEYRLLVEVLADDPQAHARAPLLHGRDQAAAPRPVDRLMHQLFEERAAERPDAIALRGRGSSRTYGELNREANRIAHDLKARGVGPETIVGVAIRRGPEMIAACLAILKAGGAYLPVEPSLPAERAAVLLAEARAALLLTTSGSLAWEAPPGTHVIHLDRLPAGAPVPDPAPSACPDNLAYVIFTSGSTGTPKGVAVAHRAVINLLAWCHRTFAFGPADVGLCVTSLGFDLSVFDIFGVLGAGGALYVADEAERADPELLLEILLREGVTFWNSAPAVLSQVAPLLPAVRGRPDATSLRLVFLSGDYTPLSLPDELRAAFPRAHVVNLGGATEATVWSNYFPVGGVDPSWRSIPYGRPIDNARYHVLDPQLAPCPPGVEGDLYIGGECLSVGYYGRPDLTAERFIPDPFAPQPGQRLYRTGDRAAYLPDGNLTFLGRADRQLKIRGFRVELEEIEHHLRSHPAVRDAVVVARPDPSGDRKLVAYLLAARDAHPDTGELRAFAARALPDYMVPNLIAFVEAFPATANGKLDRDALPWPLPAAREPAPDAAARAAQLEDEIAALFAGLLGVPRLDPAQDIWNQGATSFTVVQASNALRERHGRRIPVSAVVADPTAAGIARWLAAELSGAAAAPAPAAEPAAPEPAPVDYFSAEDRRRFKEGQWHLRPASPDEPVVPLPPPKVAAAHYVWRSSRRDLLPGPVPYDSFCRLLALLAQVTVGDRARRLYPSAGETYAVQIYLLVRDGGVERVAPGIYYYRPLDHALQQVRARPELDRSVHFAANRPLFDAAAFELYLVGQPRGIEPIYREQAARYLELEAGHLAQLLMMGQAACGLGLCPIGDLAFDRARGPLGLDGGHRFLLSLLGGRAAWPAPSTAAAPAFAEPPAAPALAEPRSAGVAIIGLAGRYPQARDLATFWANLAAGRDCITPLPAERRQDGWPVDRMWGGYLEEVDRFDAPFFHVTPRDADLADPQERLLLEIVWEALDDAGYPRQRLRDRHGSRAGVWIGSMYNEYPFFGVERSLGGEPVSAGAGLADLANRVSYCFDLRGPSMTIDTHCSSSLTSLHLAVESLRRGECEVAIAGGVNLSLHPNKFVEQARHGMPSTDHRCRSFGAGGDGFVPGEGVGVAILKPLHAALADGDRIHAVLRATAVNHGGRTNGYMVPSAAAQTEVIRAALRSAGVPASTLGYIEAHGTGTELGDPIEIAGLERAFAGEAPALGHWPIGSVKSSIGHLEGASGIASLTKVVLQLREQALAPSLHAEELNPNVDWERSPFRVQRRLAAWPAASGGDGRPLPRRAGISSFGAGGANAHAIVEEAPPLPPRGEPARGPQLAVLSALDEERLRAVARSLAESLAARSPALADVACTLQVGREHLRERLALVVTSVAELREALDRFGAGDDRGAIRGRAAPGIPSAETADLAALGRAWVRGGAVEWARLHAGARPRIVDLPSYPFARRRHWVPWAAPRREPLPPLYRKTWRSADDAPAAPAPPAPSAGRLLCLFHDGSEAVARELVRQLGPRVTLLREGAGADAAAAGAAGWIDLCDLNRRGDDPGPWLARVATLQRWLGGRAAARVLHVTSGLQDLDGPPPSLAGARVAGLVRMLRAEQPRVLATTLDLDAAPAGPADAARQIAAELERGDAPEVCLRGGRRYVPELRPVALSEAALRVDPARVYVVTGGTRGLGALVARHLVERGARLLALLGARRPDTGDDPAAPLVRELEAAGAKVVLYRGPLSARAEVDAFLARARGLGDLGGIVHCAGRTPDDPRAFARGAADRWRSAYEPKVDGLEVLAELCARDRPAFFLLFSSVAGSFPALAAGAAEYAAASAFLDWFAAHRARAGKPWFRSVAWPSWRGAGAATPEPAAYARLGLDGIGLEAGLRLFDAIAAAPSGGALVVAPCRGAELASSALLEALPAAAADGEAGAPPPGHTPPVPPWLTALFAESLGAPASDLAPDVPFGDLGIGSLLLAELLQKLEARVGRPLEPAFLLDHPTLASLAAALPAREVAAAPRSRSPSPSPRANDRRIAVIGAACRFPGAPDLATFWTHLRDGRCAIGEVPPSRWSTDDLYRPHFEVGKSISKWGGFLAGAKEGLEPGIEDFDPAHFKMSDEEAICLDPAVRLILEGVETCLADAGYTGSELAGRGVGVFAGARASDYWRRAGARGGGAGFGADQSFIAARVAHHLDLAGPCFVVDSACSSSLVAVQLAARSLLAGESELAFAAGVDVLLDERPYLELSAARALSPSGRCRVFDERADGFVPGEGCGVLLLKPLDRALRDGDRVRAIIEAIAVNNDGRTVGLTTPNPAAQTAAILRALAQSGLGAEDIAMIEAHGTGTMLGDPIELRALTDAFARQPGRAGGCAIGSVKSNLGHLLSAAGIAGLIKVVLSLEHGEIPPTLFCERPNPRFDFKRSPFYPNVTLRRWPEDRPLRAAGVSAFGFGGTNAHLIATALAARDHAATPARRPLEAPRFQRRRLWLDRGATSAPRAGHRELIASILELEFVGNG